MIKVYYNDSVKSRRTKNGFSVKLANPIYEVIL